MTTLFEILNDYFLSLFSGCEVGQSNPIKRLKYGWMLLKALTTPGCVPSSVSRASHSQPLPPDLPITLSDRLSVIVIAFERTDMLWHTKSPNQNKTVRMPQIVHKSEQHF